MSMPDFNAIDQDFLDKITTVIEENLSDERFGVSELAREINMSRSNLLRRVKKLTRVSASQFIRQVRLKKAMDLLGKSAMTVSEVSYQVGFSSPSYFIKCFHDYYGYPPGEVGKRDQSKEDPTSLGSSHHTHQLAAIMFTDIEGYTALMQHDEAKAVEYRNRHREVFNTITKKFNGRILQYYGDGTLSTFSSAIDAVRCGIEMQLAFREEPQIPVRIGIHTGDIIVSKDEIIGDGVNIASRIESLACAGSVFISEKVFDEVKNQSGIQTASMGVYELKNVDKPIEVFAITNPGLAIPQGDQIIGKTGIELKGGQKDIAITGNRRVVKWALIFLAMISVGYVIFISGILDRGSPPDLAQDPIISKKSIAVLPFINDSNDSSNVYIINGLMESILNNLQKIEDLRVISRTSTEKYRNNPKTIPELAKELNVNYIVEGSGQKIGNQIMLNIQLIEAKSDNHLWGEQYNRDTKDIFALQLEVAKNIADKIQVIITPEEKARLEKNPTDDPIAYDYFLKGLDLMHILSRDYLEEAITFFIKAIEQDNEFALAYAEIAISYFFLDFNQAEKKYSAEINENADKALLYDPQLPESLMAKALTYYHKGEYLKALPHLEKALEYNPNSAWVINMLADFYTQIVPDTEKYLEYALKGIQLDITANDSMATSYVYMHLSNAFIQSGFIKEAEEYITKSLEFNPENLYSEYVRAYILYAKDKDFRHTKELLINALQKEPTRYDIISRIVDISYYMRDYAGAYDYFRKLTEVQEALNQEIMSRGEYAKYGLILSKMGLKEESKKSLMDYKEYAENDESIYKHLSLAAYYSYNGDTQNAIEHFRLYSLQDHYYYWILVFVNIDPLFENIKDLPEFKNIYSNIETKFWNWHKQIKTSLETQGLI